METSDQADGTMWGLCSCPCRGLMSVPDMCHGKDRVLPPFLLGYSFLVAMALGLQGFHLCT